VFRRVCDWPGRVDALTASTSGGTIAVRGTEHELVSYPCEGRPITERAHQIDLLNRTRAWFARWLGKELPLSPVTNKTRSICVARH
jgi:hypothetical protein